MKVVAEAYRYEESVHGVKLRPGGHFSRLDSLEGAVKSIRSSELLEGLLIFAPTDSPIVIVEAPYPFGRFPRLQQIDRQRAILSTGLRHIIHQKLRFVVQVDCEFAGNGPSAEYGPRPPVRIVVKVPGCEATVSKEVIRHDRTPL